MSLFSALVNVEKTPRPKPPLGFSKFKVSEAEKAISGNLCRCTGYRPIADACKSFTADVDMEDLGLNSFWRKGDSKDMKLSSLPSYKRIGDVCTFPQFLKSENKYSLLLDSCRYSSSSPVSIEELQRFLSSVEDGNGSRVKVVVGNTGLGYYKEVETLVWFGFSALISFKDIPGENIGVKNRLDSEPLFADEFTRCVGQYIAFVVIP